jgi:ribulose-bisphosphate carboxylase large chain
MPPYAEAVIRATFELEPQGSAEALALMESTGMAAGPDRVRGQVVSERDGVAVVEFPETNWGRNVSLLVSALVAGEATEADAFRRCRLVGLELPDGLLPGPAFGAHQGPSGPSERETQGPSGPSERGAERNAVGVIVKPSLGLTPAEVAEVVEAAAAGGARFVKDDELLGDPAWCPLEERVRAVAKVLPPGVVYCANVTGPSTDLVDRARRAVDLGATGVMVNAFAQGLDALLALRDAALGVPILGHRVGSGPITRNDRFGASGPVLARLLRLCGADYVIAGGFDGKLYESPDEVRANLAAIREPCGPALPAVALLGGGLGAGSARAQVDRAGGTGIIVVLGSRAYGHPGGIEAGVRAAVAALEAGQ